MMKRSGEESLEPDFWAPRLCMREPIEAIFVAAEMLRQAADAHVALKSSEAERLLAQANMPEVRTWTESLWGSRAATPEQWRYHRVRKVEDAPPHLPKADRAPIRMPTRAEQVAIIAHYGRHCVFCGIPLVRAEVRMALHRAYPEACPWGTTNPTQHAALQCMWLQFDHLLPHSRGGGNDFVNVVVTCAGCNFGRMHYTIEELGLADPRDRPRVQSDWDGLEKVLQATS